MKTLTILALMAAAPAAAQTIGAQYRCEGPEDLPDVLAVVGETTPLSTLLGETVEAETTVLHLQLVGDAADLPLVPHAPFEEGALADCVTATTVPFDRAAFATGLESYEAAVRADDAGYFQISPAEAYWLTIGGMDSDGG